MSAQSELDKLLLDIDFSSRARGKYREVTTFLAELAGVDPERVYAAYVSGGSKNVIQRADQAKPHQDVLLLVLDDEHVDSSQRLLAPVIAGKNLQAVLLAVENGDGSVPVRRILHPAGLDLAASSRRNGSAASHLANAFPQAEVVATSIDGEGSAGGSPTFAALTAGLGSMSLPTFTRSDCKLFSRTGGLPWTEISDKDKTLGKNIRARLDDLARATAETQPGSLGWESAVSRHLKQPTAVNPPTAHGDLWCCVYPAAAPGKSNSLQVALIIKAEGAELCFALGSGQSSAKNSKQAKEEYAAARARLGDLPKHLRSQLEDAVEGFDLRRSWRNPGAQDMESIEEWLAHAASGAGASASISRDFTTAEVYFLGAGLASEFVLLARMLAPIFEWVYEGQTEVEESTPPGELTVDHVRAEAGDLQIDDEVYAAAVAALRSGKHVILTGPPGTGKTTLAEAVCRAATAVGRTSGHLLTTATSDWTTYETIGGLRPTEEKTLEFREGLLLEAIRKDRWLIVDELNRAPFDQAFGQLFTVLSGQSVVLPYVDPASDNRIAIVPAGASIPQETHPTEMGPNWRLVATMNVFDKDLLFEMSYALMRRFAFVEVPAPEKEVYEELIDGRVGDDTVAGEAAKALLAVRGVKEIGPATYLDLAAFFVERRALGETSPEDLILQGFYSYLLPQLEGIDERAGRKLLGLMKGILNQSRRERLLESLVTVLGHERSLLVQPVASATQTTEEDD